MSADPQLEPGVSRSAESLVFVGFNSRIAALDRETGELVWSWTSPKGSGFVSLLIDGDRVFASVKGYTYCLDAVTGELVWSNPLKGFGLGIACLATSRGDTTSQLLAALAEYERQESSRRAAAAGS